MNLNEYIKVGIVGAAGYTAGELLRILANHPAVKVVFAQSGSPLVSLCGQRIRIYWERRI